LQSGEGVKLPVRETIEAVDPRLGKERPPPAVLDLNELFSHPVAIDSAAKPPGSRKANRSPATAHFLPGPGVSNFWEYR
jgi:hypothetical protein